MTINKKDTITIPKWLLMLLIPVLVGGVSGLITSSFTLGKNSKQIEINTKRLDMVESDKVNLKQFSMIEKSLERIENKLDLHLMQPTSPIKK